MTNDKWMGASHSENTLAADGPGKWASAVGHLQVVAVVAELDIQNRGRVEDVRVAEDQVPEEVPERVAEKNFPSDRNLFAISSRLRVFVVDRAQPLPQRREDAKKRQVFGCAGLLCVRSSGFSLPGRSTAWRL